MWRAAIPCRRERTQRIASFRRSSYNACVMTNPLPMRHHPVHPPPIVAHNRPVVLFVSVCVQGRRPILANVRMQSALLQAWQDSGQWRVGRYMIMPDHIHFFCIPNVMHPENVKKWVKFWKGRVRRILSLSECIWQRDCWDTQIRDADHYAERVTYMQENPVRKHLVSNTEEWPYQGRIHVIQW